MKEVIHILKLPDTPIIMLMFSRFGYDMMNRMEYHNQVYIDAFYIVATDICFIWIAMDRIRQVEDTLFPKNEQIRKAIIYSVIILLLFEIILNMVHMNVDYDYFRRMTSNPLLDILRATVVVFYLTIQYLRYRWE